jgi:hypothetical protein
LNTDGSGLGMEIVQDVQMIIVHIAIWL